MQQLSSPILYAPWRDRYLGGGKENNTQQENKRCPFCLQIAEHANSKYFILRRFEHHVVMLNLYPYAKGHLLIVPYEHVKRMENLSLQSRRELIEIISSSTAILENVLHAQGINIGVNLGSVAGASVPDHLHVQIVPRRKRDIGFIQLIGKTNVASCDLQHVYKLLKPAFEQLVLT